jgi:ribonuclease-3
MRTEALPDRLVGIDYRFSDPRLLRLALTHRSAGHAHYERLEFLGDAILSSIVAQALFERYPKSAEGVLTRLRASLVREETLAEIARQLNLGEHLRLGGGELRCGGFRRDSILADALEAIIGAIFLDGGWLAARDAVLPLMAPRLIDLNDALPKDAKTELQEWLQARALALPRYELIAAVGADHDKTFRARCEVEALNVRTEGEGSSRRAAEMTAAQLALDEVRTRSRASDD